MAARGSDQNAFLSRARRGASSSGDVRQFSTGQEIIDSLQDLSQTGGAINTVNIHSHAFSAGVIGDGYNVGLYIGWGEHPARAGISELGPGAGTSDQLVDAITNGSINIVENGQIVFFGCNTDALASHLSQNLGSKGRGDITVIGASNSVYEGNGSAMVDRKYGYQGYFNSYQNGVFVEGSATKKRSYK